MFHSILILLTTFAMAVHALLGCCHHHTHAGHCHQPVVATLATAGDHAVGHGHCQESCAGHLTPAAGCGDGQGREQRPCHPTRCEEPDCSFVSNERSAGVASLLLLAGWVSSPVDAAATTGLHVERCPSAGTENPHGQLLLSVALRAQQQVWLL